MKTHTMNDCIYFKLTETGHRILNENAEKFHRDFPHIDMKYKWEPWKGEWYKEQLHKIFKEFGAISFNGRLLPVTDLTFEEPAMEEDNEN